jgi:hypothetical protein
MVGVGAFDHPAARMGVVDVNRKGRQSCGQLLIEGILGLSCLTRRGRRIGPAGLTPGPSAGRAWGPVAHLASQMGVPFVRLFVALPFVRHTTLKWECDTPICEARKRKSRVVDTVTLSHLVYDRSS